MKKMDTLSIVGIPLTTLIGVFDWEQITPQTLYCDLTFETDAAAIAKTDEIGLAINYATMTESIQHFVENHHFQLIETLADRLAAHLLTHFPTHWLRLTLHKPSALKQASDVMISIERTK